jgi:hypothetical protein
LTVSFFSQNNSISWKFVRTEHYLKVVMAFAARSGEIGFRFTIFGEEESTVTENITRAIFYGFDRDFVIASITASMNCPLWLDGKC